MLYLKSNMALGEYLGAGSSITKWLYRLNWDANDASWNANNWTATNVTRVNGKFGQGASFAGNGNIVVPSNLGIVTNVTMSCFVKMNSEISSSSQIFLTHTDATTKVAQRIQYDYNGWTRRIVFVRTRLGVIDQQFTVTKTLWTTNYYNCIYTYNWSIVTGYIDWISVWSVSASWTWSPVTPNEFNIWSRYDSTTFPVDAIIDEVIIENRVRSQSEIQKYYTYTKGRFWI